MTRQVSRPACHAGEGGSLPPRSAERTVVQRPSVRRKVKHVNASTTRAYGSREKSFHEQSSAVMGQRSWRPSGFQIRRRTFDSFLARYGDVRRDAVLPCKQDLRVRLPTSPPP